MHPMGYRLYLFITAGAVSALCLVCAALAFWLQPITGDLTRLGGYPESEFGWDGEQMRFSPPIAPVGVLGRAYDVVVVGDSFSMPVEITAQPRPDDRTHWTDFFKARTRLSVASFNRDRVPLEKYLASDGFLKTPPKLLVVEYAERTLQWAPVKDGEQCAALAPARVMPLPLSSTPLQPQPYDRDQSHRLDTGRIDNAVDFLTKNVPRWIAGVNTTQVSTQPLSRGNLFTSNRSTELLVFADDFVKANLPETYLQSLACYFTEVQSRVEANGTTKFVLMIAPDRTTAYGAYLPALHLPNLTARLAKTEGLSIMRLDQVMKAAVESGVRDVYLPSDTHWASAGMVIASESLIRFVGFPASP